MSQSERRQSRLIFRPRGYSESARKQAHEARLAAAREKADEYRNPQDETAKDDAPRSLEAWSDLVSQRIEEAMRRGDFDNLAGRGKPVDVGGDPFVPEDQQMAFKLLRNNELVPAWIGDRQAMLRQIEEFRQQMATVAGEARRAWITAKDDERRGQVAERWRYWVLRWEEEIRQLNKHIGELNIKQPTLQLEIFKLRLDDELRRVGVARTLAD